MSRSDVLVDADWVEAHLDDAEVVLVEVDEDTSAYDKGHIRGAVKIDWKTDLQDPVRHDFVDKTGFENLLSAESGSMSRVAERSGLERTHLYRKLKALGLPVGRREEG